VLYYYALEEFGKALYLIRLKDEFNEDFVEAFLYDHNIKIKEDLKHNPDLLLRKLQIKREWEDPNAEMFRSRVTYELSDDAIIDGFFERSLWLVDYDIENSSGNLSLTFMILMKFQRRWNYYTVK